MPDEKDDFVSGGRDLPTNWLLIKTRKKPRIGIIVLVALALASSAAAAGWWFLLR